MPKMHFPGSGGDFIVNVASLVGAYAVTGLTLFGAAYCVVSCERKFGGYRFEDVNGDGVEDKIQGEMIRYGVNMPDGRRIYIPKEEFDGSGR